MVLSLQDTPQEFASGQEIAHLISLWCPEQTHQQTGVQVFTIHGTPANAFAAEVDGWFCACNLGTEPVRLPAAASTQGSELHLGRWEPAIVQADPMDG